MAEVQEVLTLVGKEDSYAGLYLDLIRRTTTLADVYHWLADPATQDLAAPLRDIQRTATAAVEEFDKVRSIRKSTAEAVQRGLSQADELRARITRMADVTEVNEYVQLLAELRAVRGEVISLKELRYVDAPAVEKAAAELADVSQQVAGQTVAFLLRPDALKPYATRVQAIAESVEKVQKVSEANEREKEANAVSSELELLIEVVGSLPMDDPTQTTQIIDNISTIYAGFNQIRAALKRRRQALAGTEAQAEFTAQLKLLEQSLVNYLDLSDTPAKCDEYSTKLLVQLEELEGKFPDFDQFLAQLAERRETVYEAFESRKVSLVAARNQRASALAQSAERIIKAVQSRLARLETLADINGYFAADMLVEKVRQTVQDLLDLGDTVKADELQSRLKTVKEDAVRQLKDRAELFTDGGQALKFGPYAFTVNTQPLELTMVLREGELHYHLTGTNFFQPLTDPAVLAPARCGTRPWCRKTPTCTAPSTWPGGCCRPPRTLPPPRATSPPPLSHSRASQAKPRAINRLRAAVHGPALRRGLPQRRARCRRGPAAGEALVRLTQTADLLRYPGHGAGRRRALLAALCGPQAQRAGWQRQLHGIGVLLQVFPDAREFRPLNARIAAGGGGIRAGHRACSPWKMWPKSGEYLFYELTRGRNI